jgi:hypothetical protein
MASRWRSARKAKQVPLNGLGNAVFSKSGKGVIVTSAVFEDTFGLGYINLKKPGEMQPIKLKGWFIQAQGRWKILPI